MGATARDRVTARLAQLRRTYDGFDVRQTTVSVDPDEFERARAATSGATLAELTVENAAGERLLVREGDDWVRPSVTVSAGQPMVETVTSEVERRTGVRPAIVGLDRAAIVCVDCAAADAAAYQLQLQFEAVPEAGTATAPAAWRAIRCP
jgi:ADP-ribose pyrophosphatase YjhB (NUDIX family)